jgi:hypothetical protein
MMKPPPIILLTVNIAMMVVALLDMPYGYYQLLRLVTAVVAGWATAYFWRDERHGFAVVAGVLTLLFNPLISIGLDRETWSVINIAAAGILVLCLIRLRSPGSSLQV